MLKKALCNLSRFIYIILHFVSFFFIICFLGGGILVTKETAIVISYASLFLIAMFDIVNPHYLNHSKTSSPRFPYTAFVAILLLLLSLLQKLMK